MKKTVIEASRGGLSINIRELIQFKDLFLVLAYKDYRVRYAQTFLGFLWAFIQPLATLLIFTLVFGRAVNVDTGEVPYPLFAICGMSAWTYFAFVLNQSGNSIISAQNMIKKIYFPRLIIPLSKSVVGFVDFFITLAIILVLMVFYEILPSTNIIYLPIFIIITIISALGAGIWLSALTIRFRDFQHIVPFIVQIGLYATPIAYPAELITKSLPKWVVISYYLNPMAGVVEGFRWSILGNTSPSPYAYISLIVVLVLFVSSLFYFRKMERVMADLV